MAKRRRYTDRFEAKVPLEASPGDRAIQEIAAKHRVHRNRVRQWKRQAVAGMADVFARGRSSGVSEAEAKELHAKIGRLAVENGFLFQGRKR